MDHAGVQTAHKKSLKPCPKLKHGVSISAAVQPRRKISGRHRVGPGHTKQADCSELHVREIPYRECGGGGYSWGGTTPLPVCLTHALPSPLLEAALPLHHSPCADPIIHCVPFAESTPNHDDLVDAWQTAVKLAYNHCKDRLNEVLSIVARKMGEINRYNVCASQERS